MDVPTDRVTMTLVIATGVLALIGFLLSFRVSFREGWYAGIVLPIAVVGLAVAVVALTWFGLGLLDRRESS